MSSVSSATGNTSLLQWFQQLAAQQAQAQNSVSSTGATTATDALSQDPDGDGSSTSVAGASGHHGHHGKHGGGLSTQLQDAITSALGSAGSNADPNQVIQTAIENLFNGSNGSSATSNANGSSASTTATATDPSTGAPLVVSDPSSAQSAFAQLLQSNGVSPQQFQQDFTAALQDSQSQGGSLDFAKVFQNFPPGSVVDTTA